MDNLTFDPVIEININLAQSYIEKHQHFTIEPPKGRCLVFSNGLDKVDEDLDKFCDIEREITKIDDHMIRRKFSEKLKENFELFCQLEYLIRESNVEDTKNHLKLILKYLDCYASVINSGLYEWVLITDKIYLSMLGYVVHHEQICLFTTMKTAPLCHLFYEVCLHAGIKMSVAYINNLDVDNVKKSDSCLSKEGPYGCVAVLTEHADIHSAVDVLVYCSPQAPWNIYRVLVQESVYEEVIAALSAKGRRMTMDRPTQYVEAYETRRGTVAVTIGDTSTEPSIVRLVKYRTVRELLELLAKKPRSGFMSVWCAESAQADEIATSSPIDYVWINGHGDFDGPPDVALAIYTAAWQSVNFHSHTQILRLSTDWSALEWKERKSILLNIMDKFPIEEDSHTLEAYPSLENFKPLDPSQIQRDKITFVVDNPEPKTIVLIIDGKNILSALEFLVRGYLVCLENCSTFIEHFIFDMNKTGVPIKAIQNSNTESIYTDGDFEIHAKSHIGNKKVIQTTFGTMYAN